MSRKQKVLLIVACLLALLAMAAVVAVLLLPGNDPYAQARSTMDPNGNLQLREQANGTLLLSWPAGENADGYLVEILDECVRITCKNCRATKEIPTDSLAEANAFLHCTHIDLV